MEGSFTVCQQMLSHRMNPVPRNCQSNSTRVSLKPDCLLAMSPRAPAEEAMGSGLINSVSIQPPSSSHEASLCMEAHGASCVEPAGTSRSSSLLSLPRELISNVLTRLDLPDMMHAALSCRYLHSIADSPQIWMHMCKKWRHDVSLSDWSEHMASPKALYRALRSLGRLVGAWSAEDLAPRGGLLYISWGTRCSVVASRVMPEWTAHGLVSMRLFEVFARPDGRTQLLLHLGRETNSNRRSVPGVIIWESAEKDIFHLEACSAPIPSSAGGQQGGAQSLLLKKQKEVPILRQPSQTPLCPALHRFLNSSTGKQPAQEAASPSEQNEAGPSSRPGRCSFASGAASGSKSGPSGRSEAQQQLDEEDEGRRQILESSGFLSEAMLRSVERKEQLFDPEALHRRALQLLMKFSSVDSRAVDALGVKRQELAAEKQSLTTSKDLRGGECRSVKQGDGSHASIPAAVSACCGSQEKQQQVELNNLSKKRLLEKGGEERLQVKKQRIRTVVPSSKYRRLKVEEGDAWGKSLSGLWSGVYGPHGLEVVNIRYVDSTIVATKVLGDPNVPCGEVSFRASIEDDESAALNSCSEHGGAAEGDERREHNTVVKMYHGEGQIAGYRFNNPEWVRGRLLVDSQGHIAFVWDNVNLTIRFQRLHLPELVKGRAS